MPSAEREEAEGFQVGPSRVTWADRAHTQVHAEPTRSTAPGQRRFPEGLVLASLVILWPPTLLGPVV